jgi:HAD superfamily hydrolase (TIGR01509 family)
LPISWSARPFPIPDRRSGHSSSRTLQLREEGAELQDGTGSSACRSTLGQSRDSVIGMGEVRLCLLDVYDTVLSHSFAAHAVELPALARIPEDTWNRSFFAVADQLTDGRLTLADAYRSVLRSCDVEAEADLVAALVDLDRHLLFSHAHLYEDTAPFLGSLRQREVRTVFVSNCAENTRALLHELGLLDLVDGAVLSCEVGCAKPAPAIYERALDLLGASATEAVLIDDQPSYCRGAIALGMRAVRLDRSARRAGPEDIPVALDLRHAERLIWSG